MTFLNVDDNFAEHPKVDVLTDNAFRLHVAALCYCSRLQTDGEIEASKVARLVPRFRKSSVAELVAARLWIPIDTGYAIHDYLDWNRSRAQIAESRDRISKVRSAAGKKGADARWHKE
jgi:hypothetical protein